MQVTHRAEHLAAILTPQAGDEPADLEDAVHDEYLRHRERGAKLAQIVLDLSQIEDQAPWLKAAGPELPDANLRVALGTRGFLAARALRLDAVFDWHPDVEAALRASR